MKAYVITIMDNPSSVACAQRCIESARKVGIEVEIQKAFTPESDPVSRAASLRIPTALFREKYSRFENCLAAFLSHEWLWHKSIVTKEEIMILEHDAVFVNSVPSEINHSGVINLGFPSYGRYNIPTKIGVNPLTSKQYFPGAHAYRVTPAGAKLLIDESKRSAGPTDLFLGLKRFPWIQEYYPWPVESRDDFTTIQNENGIQAKHRNGPGYQIL